MPFKINISQREKTYKLETDTEFLVGKKIGEKIEGKEIKPELEGYELEITGTSDKAGFPGMKTIEGTALRKVLLKKGFGMRTRPRKEGKGKPRRTPKGLRLKKTVRGNTISRDTIQVNMKVTKQGEKKLEEIFPKAKEKEGAEKEAEEKAAEEEKKEVEKAKEGKREETKPEESKERKEKAAEEEKEETKPKEEKAEEEEAK